MILIINYLKISLIEEPDAITDLARDLTLPVQATALSVKMFNFKLAISPLIMDGFWIFFDHSIRKTSALPMVHVYINIYKIQTFGNFRIENLFTLKRQWKKLNDGYCQSMSVLHMNQISNNSGVNCANHRGFRNNMMTQNRHRNWYRGRVNCIMILLLLFRTFSYCAVFVYIWILWLKICMG